MQIYLDIDGVMVPANSWRRPPILEDGFPAFSSKAVSALNKLVSALDADIVLTTSHKHLYTLKDWQKIFNRRNIQDIRISRLPKNTRSLTRLKELLEWFDNKNVPKNFVIIDDDKTLNSLPSKLKNKLIQTSGSVGLTDDLVEEGLYRIKKAQISLD